ncbi:MAG: DUF58 domain-containing protein [Endozoicomonas sp.]
MAKVNLYTDVDSLMALQAEARALGLTSRERLRSLLQGRAQTRIRGNGLDIDEVRPYQWGDDPRHIDWKMTARLQKPHVKLFTEERETPMVILVDQRQDMFLGTRLMTKSFAAATLAGLFAWIATLMGERVEMLIFDDQGITPTPTASRFAQLPELFMPLVRYNQKLRANDEVESAPQQLVDALAWSEQRALSNGQLIVISDFIGLDDSGWLLLERMNQRSSVIAVTVHDFLDAHWPEAGQYLLCEPGYQAEFDLGQRTTNRTLQDFRQQRLQHVDDQLVRCGALSLQVNTSESLMTQLGRQLSVC